MTIKSIELLSQEKDKFIFKTLVSKGCYIRSLINDIGNSLNTYATMTSLIRTKQGKISLEQTSTLNDVKIGNYKLYKIDEVLDIDIVTVSEENTNKIKTGQKLNNEWNIKDKVLFKDKNNQILGIYQNKNNTLSVWKNFI